MNEIFLNRVFFSIQLFSFSDKIMTTTIRTNDNGYSNGLTSSNFININNWFASFQVCIY